MPFAEPTNVTGMLRMFQYTQEVSEGVFMPLLLISLYIIVAAYLKYKDFNTTHCLMTAGFFVTISAIFLRSVDLISDLHFLMSIASLIVPLVYGYIKAQD